VLITLSNVAQVNLLFKQIIKGNKCLNLALILAIQKLRKGAAKAIANCLI